MTKWICLWMAPLVVISTENWILIWMFLEISTFSFITISKSKSEEMMKYFLVQSLGSIILMASATLMMNSESTMNIDNMFVPALLTMSLALKSSLAPLHSWVIEISQKIEWKMLFLLLSIQKLAPMFILAQSTNKLMMSLIIISSIVGTLSQMNCINLKDLMAYSSISHSSWMIISCMFNLLLFFFYFLIYCLIMSNILMNFHQENNYTISSSNNSLSKVVNLLSFSGMPPLLGFFPKWMIVMELMKTSWIKMTAMILILMSCLNTFIYLKIFSNKSLNTPQNEKTKMTSSNHGKSSIMMNSLGVIYLMFNLI